MKLLAWVAVLGFVFGLIGFGQLAEDQLRIGRNKLHPHAASGDIVFISIDDKSLQQIGRWPWPRERHATLIDQIHLAGAQHIYFDIVFEVQSDALNDLKLARAIARSGRVTLPLRAGPSLADQRLYGPLPILRPKADLASIRAPYNYQNAVWELPLSDSFEGKAVPSFAAGLAGVVGRNSDAFRLDYSLDVSTIPRVSAADIIKGRIPRGLLKGRRVVIGADSSFIGDRYFIPAVGQMAGSYVQIIGAETLKRGTPLDLGWVPAFLIAVSCALLAIRWQSSKLLSAVLGPLTAILTLGPAVLEANQIFVDVAPALFVTVTILATLTWRRYKSDGLTNAVSGLPNLTALKIEARKHDQALVAAKVLNYADIVASLPADAEKALVEQIVARLKVGGEGKVIHHGDGGIFSWFEEARLSFADHINALHAMFHHPVRVGDLQLDLSVCFGVEIGSSRSVNCRLASALAAAEEAAHEGLRWKIHDPEELQDARWRLSILSKLDEAIDNGEVWVAYQPKLDLKTRRIIGAEALARWTHPEKGPIAASEFIPAAEQHDRIGKLTDFVLDQAISSAARINAAGRPFHIAVNLSARLLGDRKLTARLSETLIRHLLDPELLTLELTETSAITSHEALQTFTELRRLGVRISIDDYGTGLSTLDYLKKVPASEIKIDQSFVRGLMDNRSDKVMVQSTIALAHSLGRTVVAEGVETREVLDALSQMKCDVAQGFIIGRPMSVDSLRRRLLVEHRRSAA